MLGQFSGAVFDRTRNYRFVLWRFWGESPRVLFIGLNPSTANELQNDPTIRRCLGFAQKWGYGGMFFCNLYSFVSTNPRLLSSEEAIHSANIPAINMAQKLVVMAIVAWGDGIEIVDGGKNIASHIASFVAPALCFGYTKKGNPKHPLYLASDSKLVEFK